MFNISRSSYNIIVCALSFAVLFSAYNTLQNIATTLFPGNLGAISLGVLYAVAGVTVFAGPALTNVYGPRLVMVGGAACYVVYLTSLVWLSPALVITTSCVIGFGAAVLWIGLGVFITENSTVSTYASNTGLFWSIFQVNNIVGNLTTYFVISKVTATNTTALYAGFAVVSAVGTLGLLLLRPPPSTQAEVPAEVPAEAARKSLGEHLAQSWQDALKALCLLGTPNMALLLPIFFFSGGELAFWTGEFPQLLASSSSSVTENSATVGLVLTFAGVGEVLGGLSIGRLSDTAGRSASMLLSLVLYGLALLLTCQLKLGAAMAAPQVQGIPVIAFVAALLFGLADSGFNTNAYAMCSQLYSDGEEPTGSSSSSSSSRGAGGATEAEYALLPPEQLSLQDTEAAATGSAAAPRDPRSSVGAFTAFQFISNAGSALWYLVSLQLPVHDTPGGARGSFAQVWLQLAFLVLIAVTFVAVDRRNAPVKR